MKGAEAMGWSEYTLGCLAILAYLVIAIAITGGVFYAVWNWLIVWVVGVQVLSYKQCCIVGFILSLTFGGTTTSHHKDAEVK